MACNYISRSTVKYRPDPIFNGRLIRIDLRKLAPIDSDLKEVILVWDQLQFDPTFNILVTQDTIKLLTNQDIVPKVKVSTKKPIYKTTTTSLDPAPKRILVDVPAYYDEDTRKWYSKKWIDNPNSPSIDSDSKNTQKSTKKSTEKQLVGYETQEIEIPLSKVHYDKDILVVRVNGQHFNQKAYNDLQTATYSPAPIVSYDYFLTRSLSTIKGVGIFKIIFGGLYYDFIGIRKVKKDDKFTDEDLLFEALGIGDTKHGITAAIIFDKLRSDQRVAVFRSKVTGKPRRVDIIRTLVGRDSTSIVTVTHDPGDQDIDIGQHPILNLVEFKDKAREVIFEKSNGLHGFVLFNGQGVLQDEVPPDVAHDHTIPPPFTQRLQPAISCIRCHGTDGSDGLKPLKNDVKILLSGYLDVFGDTDDPHKSIPDTLDRLAGWYAGDPTKILTRARDDYAESILKISGPWSKSIDQTDVAKLSADKLSEIWYDYNYRSINATRALKDLGFTAENNTDALLYLKLLLPPVSKEAQNGVIPEDPRIAALLMNLEINRVDFALTYSFMALRSQQTLATFKASNSKSKTSSTKK